MLYTFLTVTLLAIAGLADDDEAVFTLTSENFNDFITSNSKVLVEFYAPWCGHCKALAPEYEKAAQQLHADESLGVKLAKVDATEEKDLASKYGVKGFPTLKFFNGDIDNPSDYGGGRSEDTIISWVTKRSQPAVTLLSNSDELNEFKNKNKLVLLGCMSGDKESNSDLNTFYSVCDNIRDSTSCAVTSDNNMCGDSSIVLFLSFDESSQVSFNGDISVESITKFVNGERFPLIDQIGPENYKDYVDRGLPLVWIALDGDNKEQIDSITQSVLPAAKANKGKLSFTWIDNNQYAQHVTNLGIASVPGLIVVKDSDKFIFSGDITNSNEVSEWFVKYSAGQLETFLKTQEVPESNDEPVFVLVGSAFKDVIGPDKDVFVEFYAPWCGHCKRLAPEYEKVGEAFKDVSNIVIAKIDATENDTPEQIRGFPTLMFYPAGTSVGIKFEGGRTAEDIISWIKEHATVDTAGLKEDL